MTKIEIFTDKAERFVISGPLWDEYSGEMQKQLYKNYSDALEEAARAGEEEINFAGTSATESNSGLFQIASIGIRAAAAHMKEHELPGIIRFVCPRDEITNMYKTAYNYWIADGHDNRMEVPHHHD